MVAELTKTLEMIEVQLADENTLAPMKQVLLKSSVVQNYIKGLNQQIKAAREMLPPKVAKEASQKPLPRRSKSDYSGSL